MVAFGTVAGGVGAQLTGGNFWQGAATGFIVSGLNHAMNHQPDPNKELARKIAKQYGGDAGEIREWLNNHPFERVEGGGVKFKGIDNLKASIPHPSGTNVKNAISYLRQMTIEDIATRGLEYFIKGTGQVLSSTELNEVTPLDTQARNNRIQACQNSLINHVFSEQGQYQTPSMNNGFNSFKGNGYSLFDIYYKGK